jgi:hypothetical protein
MELKEGYAFIIDTNEYAGNFERELTAYCTGIIGDCGVGSEFINESISSIFEEDIQQVCDDHGCPRPCEIVPNKDMQYNSLSIYFNNKPTEEQINIIKERAELFNEARKTTGNMAQFYKDSKIQILGYRLIEVKQTQTEIQI